MEWMIAIRESIRYMEENIMTVTGPEEVADHVNISEMYLQRGFQILTGCSLGEYVRNRRLYLAAMELVSTDEKIIDIAYRYGYETPESFTKAFGRFHDASPSQIRKKEKAPKIFLPMRVTIEVKGGNTIDMKLEELESFELVGFAGDFMFETHLTDIPKFWDEYLKKYEKLLKAEDPSLASGSTERFIYDKGIGNIGVFTDVCEVNGGCRYLIAGEYEGGEVLKGMEVWKIPGSLWAKFFCAGPLPTAMNNLNRVIWFEWLPENPEYELGGSCIIERYNRQGRRDDIDYRCEIWIPLKKRQVIIS
ncbi:MAG: AraC family transcriptional regulator [Lachnospiraceae bacterium]|nr:AraC family transcriptional regulator [Lachnospiraceae bacterium]